MCQQLGHNPARCVHTGVCQDDRIALHRAFCHGARHQLTVALGKIGVARLPRRKLGGVTSYLGGPGNNLFYQVLGQHCLNRASILNGAIVITSAFDAQMEMTVVQVQEIESGRDDGHPRWSCSELLLDPLVGELLKM
jgi:hypothetical protein